MPGSPTISARNFDALILGAGAAGMMCAAEAGKRGRRVAVLERSERVGKKILISGGGRCNFTNIHCQPENFISSNPHFAKSALARYTPADFVALIEKHRIAYHEKTLGQLFCDRSAQDVTQLLEAECREGQVEIVLNTKIREVTRTSEFVVKTENAEFHAPALVVATGGLSIPKMGATDFGYDLARKFGLKIKSTKPGLVSLMFGNKDREHFAELAGVSAEVIASADKHAFREKMLITHRGLSGPAILQVSSYWEKGLPIHIDLAPETDVTAAIRERTERNVEMVKTELRKFVPARLAARWIELNMPSAWTNQSLMELENKIHNWTIIPADTEGYAKAEVTVGGIDTDELSAKTMESRKVPGLFFIGEVVDVTGHLGGFNFQWAWASGFAAGQAL